MKVNYPFTREREDSNACFGHTFSSGTAIREVFGWGGEGAFQVRSTSQKDVPFV